MANAPTTWECHLIHYLQLLIQLLKNHQYYAFRYPPLRWRGGYPPLGNGSNSDGFVPVSINTLQAYFERVNVPLSRL